MSTLAILVSCGAREVSPPETIEQIPIVQPRSSGAEAPLLIKGTISDSMCGADHVGMLRTGSMGNNDRTCVLECVKAGSKFVLVEEVTKKVWRLSDQELPAEFAGEKVLIKGKINEKLKNEVIVSGIERQNR